MLHSARIFAAIVGVAVAVGHSTGGSALLAKRSGIADAFVRTLDFKHVLRVCNAYPYEVGLDVVLGKEKLTSSPLEYKACGQYDHPLKSGDKIDFKIADASAGTFTIGDLPTNDATLMMIIQRHDTLSSAVKFQSHMFANAQSAQLAVIDAYEGAHKSEIRIEDALARKNHTKRTELLRYDSVVAMDSGIFQAELVPVGGGASTATTDVVTLPKEKYVVIRVGVESKESKAYPEEIIVFPHTPRSAIKSSARMGVLSCVSAFLVATAAALMGAL